MAEWDNDQDFAKVQWDERDFPLEMHDHHVQKVTCVFRSQRILWPPFFCGDTGNPFRFVSFWLESSKCLGFVFAKVMFDPFNHGNTTI